MPSMRDQSLFMANFNFLFAELNATGFVCQRLFIVAYLVTLSFFTLAFKNYKFYVPGDGYDIKIAN